MSDEPTSTTTPEAEAPDIGRGNVVLASIGLMTAALLSVLDQAVVAFALPDIAADVGGMESIGWIVTAFLLGSTVSGALYGRLSDRFGRRSVFIIALVTFILASVWCGFAETMGELIAARAVQGVGAGALFVIPTIVLSELYPVSERGRIQGLLGMVFVVASVGGPLVGGAITDAVGWQWIFWINLPLGLVSLILVATFLRLPRRDTVTSLDFFGGGLLIVAMVSFLLITEWGGRRFAWSSVPILALAVVLIGALILLWRQEGRADHPILPTRLLTHPRLRIALVATFLVGLLLYGAVVYLPTYLQAAFGLSAIEAGFASLPYFLTFVVASVLGGNLAGRRQQYGRYILFGSTLALAGFVLLSRIVPDTAYPVVAAYLMVLGAGFGLIVQNLMVFNQNTVAATDLAVTSSATIAIRGFGMSVGVAVFGSLLTRSLSGVPQTPQALAQAIPEVLLWGVPVAVCLVALIIALVSRRSD